MDPTEQDAANKADLERVEGNLTKASEAENALISNRADPNLQLVNRSLLMKHLSAAVTAAEAFNARTRLDKRIGIDSWLFANHEASSLRTVQNAATALPSTTLPAILERAAALPPTATARQLFEFCVDGQTHHIDQLPAEILSPVSDLFRGHRLRSLLEEVSHRIGQFEVREPRVGRQEREQERTRTLRLTKRQMIITGTVGVLTISGTISASALAGSATREAAEIAHPSPVTTTVTVTAATAPTASATIGLQTTARESD